MHLGQVEAVVVQDGVAALAQAGLRAEVRNDVDLGGKVNGLNDYYYH